MKSSLSDTERLLSSISGPIGSSLVGREAVLPRHAQQHRFLPIHHIEPFPLWHHVFDPYCNRDVILCKLSVNLLCRIESIRETNEEGPPRSSSRLPASEVRLPGVNSCRASKPS